jgi:Flp pilus assembly protein TadD
LPHTIGPVQYCGTMRFRHACLLLLAILGVRALRAQEGGNLVINGHVREEGSNAPIAAATLEISRSGGLANVPVTSGIEGQFLFHGLGVGEYVISAKKNGFDSSSVTVSVMLTGAPEVTILLRRTAPASSAPGGPISAHQLQAPKGARAAYEKGLRLLEDEKNPAGSIPEFEKAVKLFPSYYEAYTELGIANYHLGKVPEAEASLKQAVELSDGKYAEPLYLLADLYNSERKYQEGESLARQAVALDNSAWNGFFELARSLVGLKRAAEAETNALRARDLAPQNSQIYLLLANVHVLQQNYPAAVQDFDAYLKLEPNGQNNDAIRRTRDKLQKQGTNPLSTPPAAAPQP